MSASTDELFERAARAFCAPFAGVIILEAEGDAPIYVDSREGPLRVSRGPADVPHEGPGVTVWRGQRDTLLRSLESERQFAGAYVSGRLKISGDLSVAARVQLGG